MTVKKLPANPEPGTTEEDFGYEALSDGYGEINVDARKHAWARLLAKVYEIEPLVCPKCGAEMKVIAIIEDPEELT